MLRALIVAVLIYALGGGSPALAGAGPPMVFVPATYGPVNASTPWTSYDWGAGQCPTRRMKYRTTWNMKDTIGDYVTLENIQVGIGESSDQVTMINWFLPSGEEDKDLGGDFPSPIHDPYRAWIWRAGEYRVRWIHLDDDEDPYSHTIKWRQYDRYHKGLQLHMLGYINRLWSGAHCDRVTPEQVVVRNNVIPLKCSTYGGFPKVYSISDKIYGGYAHTCNTPPASVGVTSMTERIYIQRSTDGGKTWVDWHYKGEAQNKTDHSFSTFKAIGSDHGLFRPYARLDMYGSFEGGGVAGCYRIDNNHVRCNWIGQSKGF